MSREQWNYVFLKVFFALLSGYTEGRLVCGKPAVDVPIVLLWDIAIYVKVSDSKMFMVFLEWTTKINQLIFGD